MRAYRVFPENKFHAVLHKGDLREKGVVCDGRTLRSVWPSSGFSLTKDRGYTKGNFLSIVPLHGVFACDARTYDLLNNEVGQGVEWLSIGVGRQTYWVVNVLGTVSEALDQMNSEFVVFSSGRRQIEKPEFKADCLFGRMLFRISEASEELYATDRFVDLVRTHKLTGLAFWDDHLAQFI
ncbi:imm11 family protein [Armatimonas sp.]|uniref:imm11 family protein n=1 Tax=Armatimonas sp. TaxID=1872638 RepID=UPI00374DC6A9